MIDSFQSRRDFIGEKDWKEYKRFAFRDDMMKLAVGVVLGNSFNKVINGMSNDLVMPFLSFLTSKTGDGWRSWSVRISDGLEIRLGLVAGELLDFLVVSLVLYLVYIKLMGGHRGEPAPSGPQIECCLCRERVKAEATRCRFCGGNPNGTKRRTRGQDQGTPPGGGDQEGTHGRVRKNRHRP